MSFDDSDMKIAGENGTDIGKDVSSGDTDIDKLYAFHLERGDLANSRRLGATLADYVRGQGDSPNDPRNFSGHPGGAFPDMKIAMHKQLLAIFALVVGIESSMPDRILTRACLNVFYDTLKKDSPALYDAMSASGAFSFYYLEYREDESNGVFGIAENFAMLCGSEKDPALMELGENIFRKYFNVSLGLVKDMEFGKMG